MKTIRNCLIAAGILGCAVAAWKWRHQSTDRVDLLMKQALLASNRGKTSEATRLYDEVLQVAPDNSLALLYRGQLARDSGNRKAARNDWERVPDVPQRESGIAHFLLGALDLEVDHVAEAERHWLLSKQLHPSYLQPRTRLVEIYIPQLRGSEIRRELNEIRRLRKWSLQELLIYSSAMDLDSLYLPEYSIPVLSRFVAADSSNLRCGLALAHYYVKIENYKAAEDLLQGLAREFPGESAITGRRAEILIQTARLEEASQILGTRLSDLEDDSPTWRSHGLLALAREDWPRAVLCLSKATRSEPENLQLAYKLGLALARASDQNASRKQMAYTRTLDRVLWELYRVWGGDRNDTRKLAPIAAQIGQLIAQLGRAPEGIAWLEFAAEWAPQDAAIVSLLNSMRQRVESGEVAGSPVDGIDVAYQALELEGDTSLATGRNQSRGRNSSIDDAASVGPQQKKSPRIRADAAPTDPSTTSEILLVDRHSESGVHFEYDNGETEFKYLLESSGGGIAVLDFDGDGRLDLYFTQGGTLTPGADKDNSKIDRLFRNLGHERFLDVTEAAGLGDRQYSQGCTAGDFDNDGDPDLAVANWGTVVFYRNNGDGTFTDISREAGMTSEPHWSSSLALADLDRDGDLDLYVVNYVLEPFTVCRHEGKALACSPRNFVGEEDILYMNRGDGTFEDVTEAAGILAPEGKGLGIVVADFDDDAWPDIYVTNDGTPNFLFRNLGGERGAGLHFEEVGLSSGAAVSGDGIAQAGMGIACADFSHSGRLDLLVTNFYLEGATYYANQGGLQFTDTTRQVGLSVPTKHRLGFGTQGVDFDLDGNVDLFVTNGHVTDARELGEPWKMPPQLFRNRGDGTFADVSSISGSFFQGEYLGRGVASADWNNDGKCDLIVVHQGQPAALLRNETVVVGNQLTLDLRGTISNRDAIGAVIRWTAGGRQGRADVLGGDGYFATSSRRAIIGLGNAASVERIEIVWPGGTTQVWNDLPVGRSWTVFEGRPELMENLSDR